MDLARLDQWLDLYGELTEGEHECRSYMNLDKLKIDKFTKEDYSVFLSWFNDPCLNSALGPMKEGDGWLEAVLNQTDGEEYSAWIKNELVAVIGIYFPTKEDPFYVISQLAVKPELRRNGIGKKVIHQLMKKYRWQSWKAFVSKENTRAMSFFESIGWQRMVVGANEHRMHVFGYREGQLKKEQ